MLGTKLSTLHTSSHLMFTITHVSNISPNVQTRKLRLREIKQQPSLNNNLERGGTRSLRQVCLTAIPAYPVTVLYATSEIPLTCCNEGECFNKSEIHSQKYNCILRIRSKTNSSGTQKFPLI